MGEKKERLGYIDEIRVLLILLVIMVHASVTYGGSGGWYYTEKGSPFVVSIALTFFNAICQSFFMALFFFIAGYFIPSSFRKKGAWPFLEGRLIRLGIPLIFFFYLLNPLTIYLAKLASGLKPGNVFAFLGTSITSFQNLGTGPLWFVLALLIFSFLYALYAVLFERKRMGKSDSGSRTHMKSPRFPSNVAILLIGLLAAAAAFILRFPFPIGTDVFNFQLGYFPLYVIFFIVGIRAADTDWLNELDFRRAKPWLLVSLGMFFLLPAAFVITMLTSGNLNSFAGGFRPLAAVYAIWEPFMAFGICFGLILFFKKRELFSAKFHSFLSDNIFAVYIIHAPILVTFSWLMRPLSIAHAAKFGIAVVATFVSSLVIARLIRLIPGARQIL